ncbi:MAG TPA: hypothetical protein VFS20_04540, partial [Longimicrobium sp.]|nr:hypothetical protein [Longimicrobium sp.]
MRTAFIYDIRENVFGVGTDGLVNELTTELFTPGQANDLIVALKSLGHSVEVIDGAAEFLRQLPELGTRVDFVFNEAKGLYGPDRKMAIPTLCRIHGIPFLGSDAYAVTLARNKFHTLAVAALVGIPIPTTALALDAAAIPDWETYPAIVKPNYESSSIGITDRSVVTSPGELRDQVAHVLEIYHQPALIQEFVEGVEIQVPVIGNAPPRALGTVTLVVTRDERNPHGIVRNEDWVEDRVDFVLCEDPTIGAQVRELAVRAFRALGCADYARIDFRIDTRGRAYLIEAATHPDIFQDSSFVMGARSDGLEFVPLIGELVEFS